MSATPRRVRGSDIRVGDVVGTMIGGKFVPTMTVTSVSKLVELEDRHGPTGVYWVTLEGAGQKSRSAIMADDTAWVLRS
jgi:hypothetical protein